jgi:hypothetical protein
MHFDFRRQEKVTIEFIKLEVVWMDEDFSVVQ